jgi:phosphopantetheinyl transferase
LLGRIAAKDAVRSYLWQRGAGPLYPVEIEIASDPDGRPRATAPGGLALAVSIAHKDDRAVALVGAAGTAPGIDLETIAPRPASFVDVAFTADELALDAGAARAVATRG